MQRRLIIPAPLARAVQYAKAQRDDEIAEAFWTSLRLQTAFQPTLPLAITTLARRLGVSVDDRTLLAVTMTGFARPRWRRAVRLLRALAILGWHAVAVWLRLEVRPYDGEVWSFATDDAASGPIMPRIPGLTSPGVPEVPSHLLHLIPKPGVDMPPAPPAPTADRPPARPAMITR